MMLERPILLPNVVLADFVVDNAIATVVATLTARPC